MFKIKLIILFVSSVFIFSGCDLFKSNSIKIGKFYNYEDTIDTKVFTVSKDENLEIYVDDAKYLEVYDSNNSANFSINGNKIKFIADINNSKNIYTAKIYVVNKHSDDYLFRLKIIVEDSNNNGSIDNNSTIDNGDNNSTNGDNNSTGGNDNNSSNGDSNSTAGSDDNSTNGDNNSTGGSDNNSSNGDSNSTGGSDNNNTNGDSNSTDNNTTIADSDNDYIPDIIEDLINKNKNNSDENGNNIKDGLEGDPLFNKQWYIRALGTPTNPSNVASIAGNDLNLLPVYKKYMGYNNGNPMIIQIVDSGVDVNHEDLKDNIDLSRSLNGANVGSPTPGGYFKPHGTMLAGIAAARAFNNIGIRGVAPFAKIAGSNWLVQQSLDGLEAAWYSGDGANEIAVTNNSWGTYYSVDTFYEDIMQNGVKDLRDGKGRIYVFASGNAREQHADANIQYIINNQYAVVVGALEYNNSVASYSTPGANLWISSYGGSKSFEDGPTIATTYLSGESMQTWDEDSKKNYTYAMAGSSAAAPMVSAEIALLLEACPNLTWRDVKYILAKSAKKVDAQNSSWVTNSAGFNFSRDYGFGAINLQGAIDICQNNYSMLPEQKSVEVTKNINENIGSNKIVTIGVNKNYKIEWVEATIDIDSDNASKIDIYITSPSGTKVQLVKSGTLIDAVHIPTANWMKGGFRFSTGAFLDEESIGDYKIEIVNSANSKLNSIKLKVYGH